MQEGPDWERRVAAALEVAKANEEAPGPALVFEVPSERLRALGQAAGTAMLRLLGFLVQAGLVIAFLYYLPWIVHSILYGSGNPDR